MNPGIDYSGGTANFDRENGIHFGVISPLEVLQAWSDSSEAMYGDPRCSECGNRAEEYQDQDGDSDDWEVAEHECSVYCCTGCRRIFGSESAFPDEPLEFVLDDGEYFASQGSDGDIFILKSPYYTHSQFCSPCAPGAGYLMSPCEEGPKTYCFGHDWFDSEEAPYPVYRVKDDSLILPPEPATDETRSYGPRGKE